MNLSSIIAPSFFDLHKWIKEERYTHIVCKGGRGSTKSSFISIELILNLMKYNNINAVVLRKTANTLETSVLNQCIWSISMLKVDEYWQIKKSPMELTYLPNGNKIIFRGCDEPIKIKSIKFAKGYCKYIWFEEWSEFNGMEETRNVLQSLMRGGSRFMVFYSFNPPKSINSWTYSELINEREDRYVHSSTYLDVPREWLGEQFFIEAEHLKEVNELAYRNEYLGEATGTGGAVFDNLTIRTITDDEINSFDRLRDGIDFGLICSPVY